VKAPARKSSAAKKAKTSRSKAKSYTKGQQAVYAYLKKKYPFTSSPSRSSGGTVRTASTAKRTLSLHGPRKGSPVKLGRLTPYAAADKPRLVLDSYLDGISAAPAIVDFASEVLSWPMYGNDTIGDCTCATVGHQIQAWTRYTGAEVTVPQEDIIQLYSAVSGYDPATGANDNGANVQDVLTLWRQSGVPVAGHKILAFAQLQDLTKIQQALWVFGSVYLGINFPSSAMDQFKSDEPWTVVQDSPIEGGHAVPLQYAGDGTVPYQVVTWAKLQGMDQGFLDTYVEEAWVVITDDWLDKNGHTPEGLDLQQLGADLSQLTGDPNPFPAPPAPQPAPPAPAPAPEPAPQPPAPAPQPAPPAPQPAPEPSVLQDIEREAEDIIHDVEKVL
jgi:hypothetical protein